MKEAMAENMKAFVRPRSMTGPVLGVPKTEPIQLTKPTSPMAGIWVQSASRKTKGRLAAIQPMVPQTRTKPKSFWASLRFAKAMAFTMDMVGT